MPSPPHSGHVETAMAIPNGVLCCRRTWPRPPHAPHRSGDVPGAHPVALHFGHGTPLRMVILTLLPRSTSSSVTVVRNRMSRPRRCCGAWKPPPKIDSNPPPRPNRSLKMSEKLPRAPWKMSSVLYWLSTPSWPYESYTARFFGSDRTAYASDTSLKCSAASSDLFRSGWNFSASLRYCDFTSAGVAPLPTPSTS